MAGKTDFWSDEFLNVLRAVTLTQVGSTFIGLFSVTPTDAYTANGGEDGTEVTDADGNLRQEVTGATGWNATDAGSPGRFIENTNPISWTNWLVSSPTLVAFGVFNLISAGAGSDLFYYGDIVPTRDISPGETATFDADALVINED